MLGLVNEDGGALQALSAVGYLLGQFPQFHHLGERDRGRERERENRKLKTTVLGSLAHMKAWATSGPAASLSSAFFKTKGKEVVVEGGKTPSL